VLTWVGSSGALPQATKADGVLARRQPGSTLKPFVHGLAFERRLTGAGRVSPALKLAPSASISEHQQLLLTKHDASSVDCIALLRHLPACPMGWPPARGRPWVSLGTESGFGSAQIRLVRRH